MSRAERTIHDSRLFWLSPMADPVLSVDLEISPLAQQPALYVVATPLGNLQDITLRALSVLRSVHVIAAEDTRHSQGLLDTFGIRKPLIAVHEHNEQSAGEKLVSLLAGGEHVALITDAGTPAISDPGSRAVACVRLAGYPVIPVPGACAAIAALSVSGLTGNGFRFVGFLPPKATARRAALEMLQKDTNLLVFYEAPHRIEACIKDLAAVLGATRMIVIAREMTKRYEEIACLTLQNASVWFAGDANRIRGEFVLVVSGAPENKDLDADALRTLSVLLRVLPLKTAVDAATEITGLSRKMLYTRALELKK